MRPAATGPAAVGGVLFDPLWAVAHILLTAQSLRATVARWRQPEDPSMGHAARAPAGGLHSDPVVKQLRNLYKSNVKRSHYPAFSEGRPTVKKLPNCPSKDYSERPKIFAIGIAERDIPGEIYLESTWRLVLSIKSRNPMATTATAIDPVMTRRSAG